uniref:MIT domain-containing protein n=1 Tax=Trichuris muris TaxID=70415 RepID=A0A5S6QB98_TRIMR
MVAKVNLSCVSCWLYIFSITPTFPLIYGVTRGFIPGLIPRIVPPQELKDSKFLERSDYAPQWRLQVGYVKNSQKFPVRNYKGSELRNNIAALSCFPSSQACCISRELRREVAPNALRADVGDNGVEEIPPCAYSLYLKENMVIVAAANLTMDHDKVPRLTSASREAVPLERNLEYKERAKQLLNECTNTSDANIEQHGHSPPPERSNATAQINSEEDQVEDKQNAPSPVQAGNEHKVFSSALKQYNDAINFAYQQSINRARVLKESTKQYEKAVDILEELLRELRGVPEKNVFCAKFLEVVHKALIEHFDDLPLPGGFHVCESPLKYLTKAHAIVAENNRKNATFIASYNAALDRLKLPCIRQFRKSFGIADYWDAKE